MNVQIMDIGMSKTRDKLIAIARNLFAKTGVENTTMNDIAVASNKGRRTLYTYFSSKSDIYNAVVESELNILYRSLEAVVHRDIPADSKLLEFINVRLEEIRNVVLRNGTLKADFFRDIYRVENVRRKLDLKEICYIKQILEEGVETDIFDIIDTDSMAHLLHHAFKGLEVPYIRGIIKGFDRNDSGARNSIINFLFNGIKKR